MAKKNGYRPEPGQAGSEYENKCSLLFALEIIGGKWKAPILWYLSSGGSVRYNELKRMVRGVSNMMLTKCLRELESDGMVRRIEYQVIPPHVEYSLTERGAKLLPALKKIHAWGDEQRTFLKNVGSEAE